MAAFPPAASIRVPASTCRVAADFRRHLRRRNFDSTQTPPLSAHYLSKSPHRNLGTKIVRRLVVVDSLRVAPQSWKRMILALDPFRSADIQP